MIKRIQVENFKSFNKLDLELGKLNILIGANAFGKSNFLQFIKFLRDISHPAKGLKSAIASLGGLKYLVNLNIGHSKPFKYEVNTEFPLHTILDDDKFVGLSIEKIVFSTSIDIDDELKNFNILSVSSKKE